MTTSWPRHLVFVRHAESEGNVLNADQKALHPTSTHAYPLTPKGVQQAETTGKWLRQWLINHDEEAFDVNYVSYYERSRQTMALMFPEAKVYEDPRLAEAQRGIWHTMTKEQVEARFPEELVRKEREGLYHYRPWGGENWPDVELRIHSFLGTLARDCGGQNVLVVCHGHWLIMFQRLLHRHSIDEALVRYKSGAFPNASVTIYESTFTDRMRLKLEAFIGGDGEVREP